MIAAVGIVLLSHCQTGIFHRGFTTGAVAGWGDSDGIEISRRVMVGCDIG
jgi:hypothetical protein